MLVCLVTFSSSYSLTFVLLLPPCTTYMRTYLFRFRTIARPSKIAVDKVISDYRHAE
ncbi:hypothetical protein WN51_02651 [Melipona quadrifasciata]|uniref:Uncharacterized protein n=1 Tax=Melipona quadrifasciata TaxID=166423 RepID=A0A0M8ZT50_9HYME|nr:hypothetical protein WN51_02651 [Melipona quadrifasciata]